MNYQLIALDLDDTLLNKEHCLSPATLSVINTLKELGLILTVATGRMLVSAWPIISRLSLSGPMITYNGAYIKDVGSGEVIYEKLIEEPLAREIIDFCVDKKIHLNLYQGDQLYVAEKNQEVRLYQKIAGVKAQAVTDLKQFLKGPVTKLLIVESDQKRHQDCCRLLKKRFGSVVNITDSKKFYIEIMARGVSKGRALQLVAKRLGIPRGKVVAIGDGRNDLTMIEWAGLGVAMAGSPPDVQAAADLIAPPHDQDGVARVLTGLFKL